MGCFDSLWAAALAAAHFIFCLNGKSEQIILIIGPRIAAKITELFSTQHYIDGYGEATLIPAPQIYLGAAVVGALIIIPLIFLIKEFKKEKVNVE